MRLSRPVVTGVLVFTLEVGLTDICLNKVCMPVVWTMSCTEMFLFKLFGLQGYYYNNIYLLVDGGWWIAKKKNNYIVESKFNSLLYVTKTVQNA
jgi:hypothetical protein